MPSDPLACCVSAGHATPLPHPPYILKNISVCLPHSHILCMQPCKWKICTCQTVSHPCRTISIIHVVCYYKWNLYSNDGLCQSGTRPVLAYFNIFRMIISELLKGNWLVENDAKILEYGVKSLWINTDVQNIRKVFTKRKDYCIAEQIGMAGVAQSKYRKSYWICSLRSLAPYELNLNDWWALAALAMQMGIKINILKILFLYIFYIFYFYFCIFCIFVLYLYVGWSLPSHECP